MHSFLASVERRGLRMAELAIGNREDALDVVQEAMLMLCRRYADREECEWRPLFYRILQNRIRDHHRRRVVRDRLRTWLRPWSGDAEADTAAVDAMQEVADPRNDGPEQQAGRDVAMEQLDSALRRLPDRQQQVFMLRLWEGLDVNQTARAMGCSSGSVKTHLSRALQTLRTQLEGYLP